MACFFAGCCAPSGGDEAGRFPPAENVCSCGRLDFPKLRPPDESRPRTNAAMATHSVLGNDAMARKSSLPRPLG